MSTIVAFAPLTGLTIANARALATVCNGRPLWLCWAAATASVIKLERGLLRLYNTLHEAALADKRSIGTSPQK